MIAVDACEDKARLVQRLGALDAGSDAGRREGMTDAGLRRPHYLYIRAMRDAEIATENDICVIKQFKTSHIVHFEHSYETTILRFRLTRTLACMFKKKHGIIEVTLTFF